MKVQSGGNRRARKLFSMVKSAKKRGCTPKKKNNLNRTKCGGASENRKEGRKGWGGGKESVRLLEGRCKTLKWGASCWAKARWKCFE